MEIGSLIAGFIGGIVAKAVGDLVSFRLLGPQLSVNFQQSPLYLVQTPVGEATQTYVRIRVTNLGKRTARNCKGFLVRIDRRNSNGEFEAVEGGHDCLQLIWSNAHGSQRKLGFDLAPNCSRFLDILSVQNGKNDWIPQGIPEKDDDPPLLPNRLWPQLSIHQQIRLTIQVVAEDAEAALLALTFNWQGNPSTMVIDEDRSIRRSPGDSY